MGELVATTIRAAGLTRCSILGHSLGAWIALEISLQQPSLLDKMILYGGSPDGYCPDRFESYEKSIERIRSQGVEAFAADLAAQWFQRGREDPMYPLAREAGRGANESSAIEHVKSWNHWKRRDRLDQVITPTLVVCGDSDRSTHPDLSIEMWKKIPRSQLYIAPDAGHIVHLEQTEAFNWTVAKFLQLKFQ